MEDVTMYGSTYPHPMTPHDLVEEALAALDVGDVAKARMLLERLKQDV